MLTYPLMHEPGTLPFHQMLAQLRKGVTRGDMQELALVKFHREMAFRREMKQRGGLD